MPAPKVFPKSSWDRFAQQLDALPERPADDRGLAVREAIKDIKNTIRAAQAKGYSLEQIIEQAQSVGIDISEGTLKRAMRTTVKRATPSDRTARTTRPASKSTAVPMKQDLRQPASHHEPERASHPAPSRATFEIQPDTDDL